MVIRVKKILIISNTTSEARRAGKITAGGATPGSVASSYTSAEGAAEWVEWLCHPVWVGVPLRTVSRGYHPCLWSYQPFGLFCLWSYQPFGLSACGLTSPSGFLPVVLSALRAFVVA